MKPPDPRAARFIDYLQRYKNDRGALANLRGGLSEARRPNAWPLLGGFKGADAIGDTAYETVAALWAATERSERDDGCLGHSCRELAGKYDAKSGTFEHDSFQSRFKRLLTCNRDEIPLRVIPVVRAAQAKGAGVNYAQLLSDLLHWGDSVRTEWARAFWGAGEEGES